MSGFERAKLFKKDVTESNSRKRACSGGRSDGVSRSVNFRRISGTISAMSAAFGPRSIWSWSAFRGST
jgi:hypothetical protein